MRKRGNQENKPNKNRPNETKNDNDDQSTIKPHENDDDNHNEGFSDWLRSNSGIEMMKLFVVANSLLVFITMAWPSMKDSLIIIKELIMGEEE